MRGDRDVAVVRDMIRASCVMCGDRQAAVRINPPPLPKVQHNPGPRRWGARRPEQTEGLLSLPWGLDWFDGKQIRVAEVQTCRGDVKTGNRCDVDLGWGSVAKLCWFGVLPILEPETYSCWPGH